MSASTCRASYSWALPLLDNAPVSPVKAAKVEQRLLSLRRKRESGDHKHGLPTPGGRAVPFSLPFATNEGNLVTPKGVSPAPLATPPTPGRKRPAYSLSKYPDAFPSFLPPGIRARSGEERWSTPSPTRSSDESSPPLSSPKRLRLNPRYECPWLASFARAPSSASSSCGDDDAETGRGGGGSAAGLELLDKLQSVTRMSLQDSDSSAHGISRRSSVGGCGASLRSTLGGGGGRGEGGYSNLQGNLKMGGIKQPQLPLDALSGPLSQQRGSEAKSA